MLPMIKSFIITVILCFLTSCTSIQTVNKSKYQTNLLLGEPVQVVTFKGERYEFILEEVSPEYIYGEGFKLLYSDISELKQEQLDIINTLLSPLAIPVGLTYILVTGYINGCSTQPDGCQH
jgi:hypothetical protein